MVTRVEYEDVQRLAREGATLVEVLPAEDYDPLHLPGARNIPLKQLDADTTADLEKENPVVVYCWDHL